MLRRGVQTFVLLGDRGIGKRTLVRLLAEKLKAKLVEFDKLHVADAREVKNVCTRVLHQSHIFLLDGDSTTVEAYNALLKLLEEPPPRCAFFIYCSVAPLPTVVSRCSVVLFPRLVDDELLEVLKLKGMTPSVAISLLPFAAGTVDGAYNAYKSQEQHKIYVKYFQALVIRDERFVFDQIRRINRVDVSNILDLADQLLMSRYGLQYNDTNFSATPQFLSTVKTALLEGHTPAIGWLRAWIRTAL